MALRDGVLGGAAAAAVIYALAVLATTTGMLAGILGDTYSYSLMGITISRHETDGEVAGSVVMSGLTVHRHHRRRCPAETCLLAAQ
jgi:hypothetical protein